MLCNHCDICRRFNKCVKNKHACRGDFFEREGMKDIKPVKWKVEGRK